MLPFCLMRIPISMPTDFNVFVPTRSAPSLPNQWKTARRPGHTHQPPQHQPDQFKRTPDLYFGLNTETSSSTLQPTRLLAAVRQKDHNKAQQAVGSNESSVNQTDEEGNTLLSIATRNQDFPMAELLLANGAEASINQPGAKYGDTPLYWATAMNNMALTLLLLAHGAAQSVNTADTANGRYPLFYAVSHNNLEMTRLLLHHGAAESVNSGSMTLQTPLYMAVRHNNPALVNLLLQHGAESSIDQFNPDGNTALNAAIQRQNPEIAFVLLAHGAYPRLVPNYFKPSLQKFLVNRLDQTANALPYAPDTHPRLQILQQLNQCRQILRVHQAVWPETTLTNVFAKDLLNHIAETAGAVGYLEAAIDAYRAGADDSVAGRSFASQALGTIIPEGTRPNLVR
jgi:ankyrin repeat protein